MTDQKIVGYAIRDKETGVVVNLKYQGNGLYVRRADASRRLNAPGEIRDKYEVVPLVILEEGAK